MEGNTGLCKSKPVILTDPLSCKVQYRFAQAANLPEPLCVIRLTTTRVRAYVNQST